MLHSSRSGAISVLKGGHCFTPRAPRVGTAPSQCPEVQGREREPVLHRSCAPPRCVTMGRHPTSLLPGGLLCEMGTTMAAVRRGCGQARKHLGRPRETPARCSECSLKGVAWARAERGQLMSVLSRRMAASWADPSLVQSWHRSLRSCLFLIGPQTQCGDSIV